MHPGFVVYNPTTLLELRARAGENLGVNFDPSHLFWQGIDPVEAIALLAEEDAIFHVHAKDTELDEATISARASSTLEPLDHVDDRSWSFRTLGLGHGREDLGVDRRRAAGSGLRLRRQHRARGRTPRHRPIAVDPLGRASSQPILARHSKRCRSGSRRASAVSVSRRPCSPKGGNR